MNNRFSGCNYDINEINTFCPEDHSPLEAQYDVSQKLDKSILKDRAFDMWRYREMLPIKDDDHIFSLSEGGTPILDLSSLAKSYQIGRLQVKDETFNPTGSFKARGLGMAVSKGYELGIREFCIPTAGNAGSALAAFCAASGSKAHIFMPRETPTLFQVDCKIMGADLHIIDGNISDCGKAMREANQDGKWFDVTTLKEPFRLEGKKTMGYEIAEQSDWHVPDVIIYPTGGGTGLIGIWKAFEEMHNLGWIDRPRTRMVAVQSDGCDPIVKAFEANLDQSKPYQNPSVTIANGLRVPHAFGHKLILETLKESNGCALSVSDQDMSEAMFELATKEGLFVSPEGAATWHAAKILRSNDWIKSNDNVLLLNTGSGYKYVENIQDDVLAQPG